MRALYYISTHSLIIVNDTNSLIVCVLLSLCVWLFLFIFIRSQSSVVVSGINYKNDLLTYFNAHRHIAKAVIVLLSSDLVNKFYTGKRYRNITSYQAI